MARTRAVRPGVTVVIPVRDRARLLEGALRSVSEQTRAPEEVIVADDGSRDGSGDVARAVGASVIVNEGGGWGPSAARNACLERVGTELVWPLDSDDLLLPGAFELLTGALARSPLAPFAFGRALVADREGDGWRPQGVIAPYEGDMEAPLCSLYARNFVPSCATLVRTAALLEVGGYPEDFAMNGDHVLWLQLARKAPPVHVPELVSVYRRHAGNLNDPLTARPFATRITELAVEDPRLRDCRPERLGVQLVTDLAAARALRRPGATLRAGWELLLREPRRARILRAALRHWRGRRRDAREAARIWEGDAGLRRLLASYR